MPDHLFDVTTAAPDAQNRRAVRPRHAASLIIVRRDQARPSVLMGRRHGGHSFMPDKWVFPGGRIDRSDSRTPSATELRPNVAAKLELTAPAALARALAMAAVRETYEEAGLLLAQRAPARPAVGPWRDFMALGALPDLSALAFVARAVTPPVNPKRFDVRFFMADAERLVSLERLPDCGELDKIAWLELEETRELNLPRVTRFLIGQLAARLERPDQPIPYMRVANGRSILTHL